MSSLKKSGSQEDRRGSTRINRFASGSGKGKILSSVYAEKKRKLDDFTRILQDSCDQIIRRFVADALKYKPDDVLDFASRWIARERGVTLEEVEKDVFQQVIDMGMEASAEEEELNEEHSDLEMQDDLNRGKPEGVEGVYDEDGNVVNYQIETEETELKFNIQDVSDENGEEAEQEYKNSDMRVRAARRVNMSFALKHLSVEDRTRIVLACREEHVSAGSRVIRQGEIGTDYYLVEEGQFRCLRKYDGDEDEMELKEYGPGDCFGE